MTAPRDVGLHPIRRRGKRYAWDQTFDDGQDLANVSEEREIAEPPQRPWRNCFRRGHVERTLRRRYGPVVRGDSSNSPSRPRACSRARRRCSPRPRCLRRGRHQRAEPQRIAICNVTLYLGPDGDVLGVGGEGGTLLCGRCQQRVAITFQTIPMMLPCPARRSVPGSTVSMAH